MKKFKQLIEEMDLYKELQETMTSAGGGIAGMHQNVVPTDNLPQIAGREADRLAIRKKKNRDTFAGCDVFPLSSEEYNNCLKGRTKYERWSRKLNMDDIYNQEMRSYSHKNPNKAVIIKDSTTGIMAYLIPPQR
jgi:hypothetical protein